MLETILFPTSLKLCYLEENILVFMESFSLQTELGVCQKNPPSSCFCENLPKLLKHLNVSWIGGLLESSAQNSCKSLYT